MPRPRRPGAAGQPAFRADSRGSVSGVRVDAGVVFRRVLDLLQIVQPALLEDAVDGRDQPQRPLRVGIEMLVDRVRRHVDDVARLVLEALDLVLRLPVVVVGDLDVAVLVQVVAAPLEHVEAFLGQVPVLARAASPAG